MLGPCVGGLLVFWATRRVGTCHDERREYYMGGCQNYGPFLGTLNIRCRIIIGIQRGTIILTTTHMDLGQGSKPQPQTLCRIACRQQASLAAFGVVSAVQSRMRILIAGVFRGDTESLGELRPMYCRIPKPRCCSLTLFLVCMRHGDELLCLSCCASTRTPALHGLLQCQRWHELPLDTRTPKP